MKSLIWMISLFIIILDVIVCQSCIWCRIGRRICFASLISIFLCWIQLWNTSKSSWSHETVTIVIVSEFASSSLSLRSELSLWSSSSSLCLWILKSLYLILSDFYFKFHRSVSGVRRSAVKFDMRVIKKNHLWGTLSREMNWNIFELWFLTLWHLFRISLSNSPLSIILYSTLLLTSFWSDSSPSSDSAAGP